MVRISPTVRWLRLVGSLKLYFSFAKYSLFYRALLQKRPMILRIEAIPPYGTHLTYTELIYGTSFYTGTPLYS